MGEIAADSVVNPSLRKRKHRNFCSGKEPWYPEKKRKMRYFTRAGKLSFSGKCKSARNKNSIAGFAIRIESLKEQSIGLFMTRGYDATLEIASRTFCHVIYASQTLLATDIEHRSCSSTCRKRDLHTTRYEKQRDVNAMLTRR